jgi:hypothetical protein
MSDEVAIMVVEQRSRITQLNQSVNHRWEELMEKAKPFQYTNACEDTSVAHQHGLQAFDVVILSFSHIGKQACRGGAE